MEEKEVYIKNIDGKAKILLKGGEPLQSHLDKDFPLLPLGLADILIEDLLDTRDGESEIYNENSLVYCLLSTLTNDSSVEGCGDPDCIYTNHRLFLVDMEQLFECDQVYSLNPNPQIFMKQLSFVRCVKNLPGEKASFPAIIEYFNKIFLDMNPAERFSVMLIDNMFESISISASIALISKKITTKEFYLIFLTIAELKKSERLNPYQSNYLKNLQERLDYLHKALTSDGMKEFLSEKYPDLKLN